MHILLSYLLGKSQRRLNFCLMMVDLYKFKFFVRWMKFNCWLFSVPAPEFVGDWDEEYDEHRWGEDT